MEDRYVLLAIQYDHSVASVRRLALVYMEESRRGRREKERLDLSKSLSNIAYPLGVPLVALYMQPVRVYIESWCDTYWTLSWSFPS